MKLIDIYSKEVTAIVELTSEEIDQLIFALDIATIDIVKSDAPDKAKVASKYLIESFYPHLVEIKKTIGGISP